MTIKEALKILEDKKITNSLQMLRRWIRQGKIEATLTSRKEGYKIDKNSFESFVQGKLDEMSTVNTSSVGVSPEESYREGFKAGKENEKFLIQYAVKEREKELILKDIKEDTIYYSNKELLHGFKERGKLEKHLNYLSIRSRALSVLGAWVYDADFNILIDTTILLYHNRKLETRVRGWYAQELLNHFESNK